MHTTLIFGNMVYFVPESYIVKQVVLVHFGLLSPVFLLPATLCPIATILSDVYTFTLIQDDFVQKTHNIISGESSPSIGPEL